MLTFCTFEVLEVVSAVAVKHVLVMESIQYFKTD